WHTLPGTSRLSHGTFVARSQRSDRLRGMAAKFAARPSATDRRATVLGWVTGRRSELLRAGPYFRVSAEPAHRRTRSAPRTGSAFADDHPGRRRSGNLARHRGSRRINPRRIARRDSSRHGLDGQPFAPLLAI